MGENRAAVVGLESWLTPSPRIIRGFCFLRKMMGRGWGYSNAQHCTNLLGRAALALLKWSALLCVPLSKALRCNFFGKKLEVETLLHAPAAVLYALPLPPHPHLF